MAFPHASYCVPFLLPSGAMTVVRSPAALYSYRV
ncbi:rhsA domain protein, partial [Shigella boydii 965-58]